jgi:hypothetical protein
MMGPGEDGSRSRWMTGSNMARPASSTGCPSRPIADRHPQPIAVRSRRPPTSSVEGVRVWDVQQLEEADIATELSDRSADLHGRGPFRFVLG